MATISFTANITNLSSSSDIDPIITRSLVANITNLSSSSDIDIFGVVLEGDVTFGITSDSLTKLSFLTHIPTAYFADVFDIFLVAGDSIALAVATASPNDVICETFTYRILSRVNTDIQKTVASSDLPNFAMDFIYNRIWIEPNPFDAEFVVEDVAEDTYMWNAYTDQNITVNDIAITGVGGVSIVGLIETDVLPTTLEVTFSTVLSLSGPPIINNTVTFIFSSGDAVVFTVLGTRVIMFPYPPQTDAVYTETYSWLTNVLRKYDGKEQRIRTR